jgi:hypothetical protein
MFVRRYREGLTFCRAGERGAGGAEVEAPRKSRGPGPEGA